MSAGYKENRANKTRFVSYVFNPLAAKLQSKTRRTELSAYVPRFGAQRYRRRSRR